MCELISWIELPNGEIKCLTGDQLFRTEKGQKLVKEIDNDDLPGHETIRRFYGSRVGGINEECTYFSSPNNFPDVIAQAIKNGEYRGFIADKMIVMLTPDALKEYAQREPTWAEWEKADAEWDKAWAEWEKAKAEWDKAYAKWEKAFAEWFRADDERENADAEWEKAELEHGYFWDLFAKPENRIEAWR